MSYLEDYAPYIDKDGKADVTQIPEAIQQDILNDKKALVIFYNHIEDCRAELGTEKIVAALIYALYEYDRTPDKNGFTTPKFEEYDPVQAAAARMIFRNMATAAKENIKKWIGRKVTNRYNGSKPKRIQQPQIPDYEPPQASRNRYPGGIKDLPGCS